MRRAWAVWAAAAVLMVLSQPARAAVTSCPQLTEALDASVTWTSQALAKEQFFPGADDPLPLMSPFPSIPALRLGAECWERREDSALDAATQASVIRASALALSIARWRDGHTNWDLLTWAYAIERMTGVEGPVTQYLSQQSAYFEESDGRFEPILWTRDTALDVLQLSALCRAIRGPLGAVLAGGGYGIEPVAKTSRTGGNRPYDHFLDVERVRTLEECPLT